jgi:hypothetical protein
MVWSDLVVIPHFFVANSTNSILRNDLLVPDRNRCVCDEWGRVRFVSVSYLDRLQATELFNLQPHRKKDHEPCNPVACKRPSQERLRYS